MQFSRMEKSAWNQRCETAWQCENRSDSALVVSVRMWWKLLHAVELEALHLLIMKIFL